MEKLFNDAETFIHHRPTELSEHQKAELFNRLTIEIIDYRHSSSRAEDIKKDLKELYPFNDNGYELAKKLEDMFMNADYNFNAEFVEYLDTLSGNVDSIHRQNVKDWVRAHNIKPKFEKNTAFMVNKDVFGAFKAGQTAYINNIRPETAEYHVSTTKNNTSNFVLKYEFVENTENFTPVANL